MLNEALFYPVFDPATKWLGQGKPFDYAQQNVNRRRVSRRPQRCRPPGPPLPTKNPFGTSGLAQGLKLSTRPAPRSGRGQTAARPRPKRGKASVSGLSTPFGHDRCGIGEGLIAPAKRGSTFAARPARDSRGDEPYAWPPGA